MGHMLHWTVAACNTPLGCFYQPQYRRLNVPIVDGSFDSIYPVTQNAKCKNCHQMHAENDTYLRHIQLGRFTRDEIPPTRVRGDIQVQGQWINKCRTCHTAASGFTDSWRAPDRSFSFDQPMEGPICGQAKAPLYNKSGQEHLLHDDNILWAVDRIPGLGRANWQQKVNAWWGVGAPCPCEFRGGALVGSPYTCQIRGQFTTPPFYDIGITRIGPLTGTSGGTRLEVTVKNNGDLVTAVSLFCKTEHYFSNRDIKFPLTRFDVSGYGFGASTTLAMTTSAYLNEFPYGEVTIRCYARIVEPVGVQDGGLLNDDVSKKVSTKR
jgi:hypothetical protein